jgi:hypothetical protein
MDRSGKIIIKPQFDEARTFSEGLAHVGIKGKPREYVSKGNFWIHYWRRFCINKEGKVVIKIPDRYKIEDFREGLAVVWVPAEHGLYKYGFMDKRGVMVIKPRFAYAVSFTDGLAMVRTGAKIVKKKTDPFSAAAEESAPPWHWTGGKRCFINRCGDIVIEIPSDSYSSFSEGLAKIERSGKYGFINRNGDLVIQPMLEAASYFSEGLVSVKIKGKRGFIDRTGSVVIQPQFDSAWGFREGLAAVKIGGKTGYLDKTGKIVIKPGFDHASAFSEGLAVVRTGGRYGYIDNSGEMVIKPQFDEAGYFNSGLARVGIGKPNNFRYGYIDKTGKYIWKPTK